MLTDPREQTDVPVRVHFEEIGMVAWQEIEVQFRVFSIIFVQCLQRHELIMLKIKYQYCR